MVLAGHKCEHNLFQVPALEFGHGAWCLSTRSRPFIRAQSGRGPFWHAFSVSTEAIHCLAFPAGKCRVPQGMNTTILCRYPSTIAGTPRMNVAYEIKLTLKDFVVFIPR